MNIHKIHLLMHFKKYNIPKERIEKIKNENTNVYESYKMIYNYIHYNTK